MFDASEWLNRSNKNFFYHSFNCFLLLNLGFVLVSPFLFLESHPLFKHFDAFDYAQLARRIAQGKAYTTNLITPLSWAVAPQLPHPEFWRPPLYPFLVASGFRLVGVSEAVPVWISVSAYLASALVVYWIVERLSGITAAFFSGALFLTAPPLYRMGVHAITESTFTLLFLVNLVVLTWRKDHPCLLGVLGALLYLTRFNAWFFIGGIFFAALPKANRKKISFGIKYFLCFLVILFPWLIRNIYRIGMPFYHHQIYQVLSGTARSTEWSIFFFFDLPTPFWYPLSHPWEVFAKWLRGMPRVGGLLYEILGQIWVPFLLAVSWFFGWIVPGYRLTEESETAFRKIWMAAVVAFLSQVIILPVFLVNVRVFIPFVAVVFLFVGSSLQRITKRTPTFGYLLVVIFLFSNFYSLSKLDVSIPDLPEKDYRKVRELVPQDALILTNKYFFLPWYTNRTSLAVSSEYDISREHYPTFKYVFLHDDPGVLASKLHRRLGRKYRKEVSFGEDFRLLKDFDSGGELYVRRSEWSK